MKKASDYNKKSEAKHNKVRFVALVRRQLRDECKESGIPYSAIVEEGLISCQKRKGKKMNYSQE